MTMKKRGAKRQDIDKKIMKIMRGKDWMKGIEIVKRSPFERTTVYNHLKQLFKKGKLRAKQNFNQMNVTYWKLKR